MSSPAMSRTLRRDRLRPLAPRRAPRTVAPTHRGGRTAGSSMTTSGSILGNPVIRLEDPRILRGDARYVDDLPMPGAAHVVFVRSRSPTPASSRSTPPTRRRCRASSPCTPAPTSTCPTCGLVVLPPRRSTARAGTRQGRFVGDIVAAVMAETRAQAVDAAEAVIVDYDPLPAVVDAEATMADDAPVLFEEHGSNVAFAMDIGDDHTIFEGADRVESSCAS